jgi:hypothetical protein
MRKSVEDWHVVAILFAAVLGFAVALYWAEKWREPRLDVCPLCGCEVVVP